MVKRRLRPSGAADREKGWAFHQRSLRRKRSRKKCPASAGSSSRRRPRRVRVTTSSDSAATSATRSRWRKRPGDGEQPAVTEEGGRSDGEEGDPVAPGPGVAGQVAPQGDLVGKGEGHGQVGVEVEEPPGLVAQAPPQGPRRGHRHQQQQAEPGQGRQQVGVVEDEIGDLPAQAVAGGDGVGQGGGDDVGDQQGDGGDARPPMPVVEVVHAEGTLQPGRPRDEGEQDQHGEGAEQGADLADGSQIAGRRAELLRSAVGDPQGHDRCGVGRQETRGQEPGGAPGRPASAVREEGVAGSRPGPAGSR